MRGELEASQKAKEELRQGLIDATRAIDSTQMQSVEREARARSQIDTLTSQAAMAAQEAERAAADAARNRTMMASILTSSGKDTRRTGSTTISLLSAVPPSAARKPLRARFRLPTSVSNIKPPVYEDR